MSKFKFSFKPAIPAVAELVVLFIEQTKNKTNYSNQIPAGLKDALLPVLDPKDFKAEKGKTRLLYFAQQDAAFQRILLVGLGESKKLDFDDWRNIGHKLGEEVKPLQVSRAFIVLPQHLKKLRQITSSLTEGLLFQDYNFKRFKSKPEDKQEYPEFVFISAKNNSELSRSVEEASEVMQGINIARDLGNLPSNHLTPQILKEYIEKQFAPYPHIKVAALSGSELEALGFGAMLSVARGSVQPPFLISMHYQPANTAKKKIALVGKGVTFDSGGISIKPSAGMDEMKFDMCGAAAVVGSMDVVARKKPDLEVIGVIPAVENMPGGNATRPGDVVTAFNGKTIEILNTDAEGRLILADAIAWVIKNYKPNFTIDFATLTGACVVALGDKTAGLFSNSEQLQNKLIRAGESSGDKVWPMPMFETYKKDIESEVADIKNIGDRWGGAITAAKFLEFFVDKNSWAHLDIAGTANGVKNIAYLGKGATGYGVRLMHDFIESFE